LKAARQYEQVPAGSASAGDYERIATAYLSAHREAKAAETLKQALVNHPSSRLWHMLGSIYYNLEEYPKAYDAFQQCFRMTPKDGSAALYMGYCALKINKTNDAREAFESATRFDRQHEAACKALAKIGYSADR
jgi:Tfp pilus assembly protein PilF